MSASLADYPYRASYDEGMAARRALKKHLEKNIRWRRPRGGVHRGGITVMAFAGEPVDRPDYPLILFTEGSFTWDAHSMTPTELKETAWPRDNAQFMLLHDATYTEQFELQILGTDEIMVSSVMLSLRPILTPHANKFGSLLLDLGDDYYKQRARITPIGGKRLLFESPDDPEERIRALSVQINLEVPSCKIVEVAPNLTVKYDTSVD